MAAIGDTLREARMRQRLDIADVEARTKIRAKYLRALENEEFGMLPGPTFVKTFLRTYAEALGLDPHLLVEEYRVNYESSDEVEQHIQSLGPPGLARDRRRRGPLLGPGSAVLLVLVAVVGALVAIGLLSNGDDGDAGGGEAGETLPRTETTPRRERRERPPPRRVVLRIVPATPTYVCVDRGAGTPVLFENTIDSPQTFRGRTLRVNLGKTDVQIVKNGRRVPVASGPNPVGFEFTPRGRRPLPLGERPCA
ncbi:MAG TPA: helix-turn-helix domain-containing protein [Thermoleophilaceae bacterium]|nr:helix-turn-helix domain-containing protein [Thermoleophilaceae bacterium]